MSKAYLGIDIGGTNTKLAIMAPRGAFSTYMIATRAKEGPERLFARIRDTVSKFPRPPRAIAAVGIGCAGLVDIEGGILESPNLPGWENTRLPRIGKRVFGVYTYADNDANAAAYGEYHQGCGMDARMFVCITLGTGVGGGIIDRGDVVRGARNFAGEIGHMTIDERGPRCKCGNRGCLEAFIGADALVREARREMRRSGSSSGGRHLGARTGLTPEHIARAARQGDRAALAVFDRAAEHLGTAVASLVNLLNPDIIGIAGGVAGGFDLMQKRLRDVVAERAFRESSRAVTIARGRLGLNAAAVGAALMARQAAKPATLRSARRARRGAHGPTR